MGIHVFSGVERGGPVMQLYEQLTLFQVAYRLMKNENYRLIHMKENEKEIWLEKTEHKETNVIRIQQGGFDWKNYLKRDIAQVFQLTKRMRKLFTGKRVTIHNLYVSAYEPVDEWDQLKKPLKLDEKGRPVKMYVYYITAETKEHELSRLRDALSLTTFSINAPSTDQEANEAFTLYQQTFHRFIHSAKKKENVFSFGKPFFTYIIIGINMLMYLFLEMGGGSMDIPTLIQFGANYNVSMAVDNEWWRIISSMFLHIGLMHLILNMIALYYLGSIVERIYGAKRFLLIYFLSGIGGGLASFMSPESISAGASGAIFGLFGALLFFGVMYKKIFFQTFGKGVLLIIGINIVFGFSVPNIDMAAHIGGLVTGFTASAIVYVPNKKNISIQLGAGILYLFFIAAMIFMGIQQTDNNVSYYLQHILMDYII